MNVIATNKRAKFDYDIMETFEAGLVLKGCEVKSIKSGHISLKGSFVTVKGGELYLTNANVPLYKYAGKRENYDPAASRKLLVRKKELKYLIGRAKTQGLTLVPISVYNKRTKIKLLFGLARGKKKFDKRERIKEREDKRRMQRTLKKV